jgi:membrane protease YdiL (CAAX protease family)
MGSGLEKLKQEGRQLVAGFRMSWRATIYFAGALALMLVYVYQGQRGFFYQHLAPGLLPGASGAEVEWWGTLYQFASAFALFLLVPLLLLKFLGREKLRDLGLGLGDVKFGFWVVILGWLVLALPGGISAGGMEDFCAEYPLAKLSVESGSRFLVYQLAYGLLYYVAWEAFFRGFLQMGLRPYIGDLAAILVQTAASTLLHIGKPLGETWAALLAGFLFGALMLRMRSIWPLVLVHWGLGLLTDVFCARASGILW